MTIFNWVKGNTATQEIARYRDEYRKTSDPVLKQRIIDKVDILKSRIAKGNDE